MVAGQSHSGALKALHTTMIAGAILLLALLAAVSGWLLDDWFYKTLYSLSLMMIMGLAGYWILIHLRRNEQSTVPELKDPTAGNLSAAVPTQPHSNQDITTALDSNSQAKPQSTPLKLLQAAFAHLLEEPYSSKPFTYLLEEIQVLTGAVSSTLFVTSGTMVEPLAWTTVSDRDRYNRLLRYPPPELDLNDGNLIRYLSDPEQKQFQLVIVALEDGDYRLGFLLLKIPANEQKTVLQTTQASQARIDPTLLAELGYGATIILHSAKCAQINRRQALSEERTAIARELHDSLAQSLSYLKIQVSRTQALLQVHKSSLSSGYLEINTTVEELRNHLNVAYRQLRELITTSRLTMNGRSLEQALEESVEEFAKRSDISFELDNRLSNGSLQVAEEMQVLHIVREALANIVRHSHASHATVSLRNSENDSIRMDITDNGIGFAAPKRRAQHHGLMIMQERAHSLNGDIRMETAANGGTHIVVTFPLSTDNSSSSLPKQESMQP